MTNKQQIPVRAITLYELSSGSPSALYNLRIRLWEFQLIRIVREDGLVAFFHRPVLLGMLRHTRPPGCVRVPVPVQPLAAAAFDLDRNGTGQCRRGSGSGARHPGERGCKDMRNLTVGQAYA